MQPFQVPAMSNEFLSEKLKQLRMSWPVALGPEVARRPHQSAIKMLIPDPVDNDTCQQAPLLVDQCVSQLQPSAALLKPGGSGRLKQSKESARHHFPRI